MLAVKTHLEVQQREDIRRDLAERMKFVPPDLRTREHVFYWQEDPSKIQQRRKSGRWLKVEILAVKGHMVAISAGASIFLVNVSKLRRLWTLWIWKNFQIRVSGQEHLCELFPDNSYLSAILDRQGLLVAAPVDLRTKNVESFSPQLLQGFWSKLEKKNPKIVIMSQTVTTKRSKQKDITWQQYRVRLAVAEYQIHGGKHFLILGPVSGKIWWLQKSTTPSEKVPLPMDPPAWQGTQVGFFFLQNFGNLLRPLEYVVPTESQVRTVLGDCISKATVISIQATQYRQYALISDFLDLANLRIREEAALATNWIKDRPEGLKFQNLAPRCPQSTEKYNCRCPTRY